ncbi:hypothetical protein, partial [Brevundimonas sp.]
ENRSITLHFSETIEVGIVDYVILPSFDESLSGCKNLYKFQSFALRRLTSGKVSFALNAYKEGAKLLSPYSNSTVIDPIGCKIDFKSVEHEVELNFHNVYDLYFPANVIENIFNLKSTSESKYLKDFIDVSGRARQLLSIDSLSFPQGKWRCDLEFSIDQVLTAMSLGVRWGSLKNFNEAIAEVGASGKYRVSLICTPEGVEYFNLSIFTCHPLFTGSLKVENLQLLMVEDL